MWVADHGRMNGRRRRRFFRTKEQAKADLDTVALQRQQAGDVWLALSNAERIEAAQVIDAARKRGLTMRQVWDAFLAAGEAAPPEPVELGDAVETFIGAKETNGHRDKYIESLRYSLGLFARGREATPLHAVTLADIDEHLDGMSQPATKQSARRRLCTFFSFSLRRGWVRDNPVKRVDPVRLIQRPPCILSVRQAARVLAWTRRHRPDAMAVVTLSMLAGIRPWELYGVTWADVNLDEGFVVVSAAASKVAQRRIVHMESSAVAWMRLAKQMDARLPSTPFLARKLLPALAEALGFERWPHDVLRHTAASYMLAHARDAAAVALELGNSVDILMRHYRELVSRRDAARFWALTPRRWIKAASCRAEDSRPSPSKNPN